MKLGLLTAPFPDRTLSEVADWAAAVGFETLEIACWPREGAEARRYAGTAHLPIGTMGREEAAEIADALRGRGLSISGLGYYPNPLHPDAAVREAAFAHLRRVVEAAALLGVGVVNTFLGGDRHLDLDENWSRAEAIWPEAIAHARDHGVTLAFENCPMIFSRDEWPGGHNIAYSPRIWRRILEWDGVGMNFDPSHLVWQMIDIGRFIREFGSRMVHVHAKDVMIDRDGLYENGVMSAGRGWQVPRMPGLGDVDWGAFFSGLYRAGYDGPVVIEHEDRRFEGSEEAVRRGFLLARDVLRPYVK
ncbi:sugar phosphate isomerase/epimerase [Rubellimicrobium sp. CFH 75288]|uniref:sugar phosphate isomerase/epimerase family protein n=1 Tax=Rubellimicrobium sp. CFH 75288 TaxID=2697034 RepID=UPI0014135813|nr:sugar phosphate isomerase/epimerase [Rubellimicrobium sp. CFH 75288]NAZ35650.1 TIM barrel protein [Rubellimicrobium sp. CFH 75288]